MRHCETNESPDPPARRIGASRALGRVWKTCLWLLVAVMCCAGSDALLRGAPALSRDLEAAPGTCPAVGLAHAGGVRCAREAVVHGAGSWVRLAGCRLVSTTDGSNWIERVSPTLSRLRSGAYGRGTFVVVGDEGAIVTSPDAVQWTLRDSPTDERLRSVVHAAGLFVAVGYGGTILTSRDGLVWRAARSGVTDRLQSVAHGNGLFVAIGWSGCVLRSTEGRNCAGHRRWRAVCTKSCSWGDGLLPAPIRAQPGRRRMGSSGQRATPFIQPEQLVESSCGLIRPASVRRSLTWRWWGRSSSRGTGHGLRDERRA